MKFDLPIVELIRLEENYDHGTFGIWRIQKQVFCYTLEPRDEENMSDISSIPAQQYICEIGHTGLSSVLRLGLTETYEVMTVPGRTGIKLHPGNTDDDTLGCILLGSTIGKLRGDKATLNSGATFVNFMNAMREYRRFLLTISEVY